MANNFRFRKITFNVLIAYVLHDSADVRLVQQAII